MEPDICLEPRQSERARKPGDGEEEKAGMFEDILICSTNIIPHKNLHLGADTVLINLKMIFVGFPPLICVKLY